MIQLFFSLHTVAGVILSMTLAIVLGLVVYLSCSRFLSRYDRDKLTDPVGSIFRVIGILFSLMLSLTFNEVVVELKGIQQGIEMEAVAIVDTYNNLKRFGDDEKAAEARDILIEYTDSIFDDDWPSLSEGQLGEKTSILKRQLEDAIWGLEPDTGLEEKLWSQILADVDMISDYRVKRFDAAMAKAPLYTYVMMFGFLLTMACFAAYRPTLPVIVFISLYAGFVGLMLFLILTLSDPFRGDIGARADTFESITSIMRSREGG